MADSMTSGEIEDVLSSIRRLVSDGNRPVFRAAPRPFAREAEKLILTPALRVPSDDSDAPTDRPASVTRFVLTQQVQIDAPPERPPLGTVVTTIAAAVVPQVEGWESETGDPVGPFSPPLAADGWIDDLAAHRAFAPDPVAEAAPEPLALQDSSPEAQVWQDDDEDDGWDVDEGAAAPHMADMAPHLQTGAAAAADTLVDELLPVVDAAALTELIREVLREELRGPFGARITANLRKMVRAEVVRAMTLRADD